MKPLIKSLTLGLVAITITITYYNQKVHGSVEQHSIFRSKNPTDTEIKIAYLAYGLKLLADYKFYDSALQLCERGLDTSLQDWVRYYIGRILIFSKRFPEAIEYFASITTDFPWYELVLQNIIFARHRMGDQSACKMAESKNLPEKGIPEFYEFLLECSENLLNYYSQTNQKSHEERVRKNVIQILYLLVMNSINPPDFLDYSDRVKRAHDLSMRILGVDLRTSLSEKKEDIAETLLKLQRGKEALYWTDDEFKKARAYFQLGDYNRSIKIASELIRGEKDRKKREILNYILVISHARRSESEEDKIEFLRYSEEYIKNFSNERFAGDLAIKLGVENYLQQKIQEAEKFLSRAARSPFQDISERARFLLKYTLGYNIKAEPKGFLLLIEKYKKGIRRLKTEEKKSEISPISKASAVEHKKPDEKALKKALEIYYLKIYLGDSRLSPSLPYEIFRTSKMNLKDILEQKGFISITGDFRSTLAVVSPPPIAFYEEIKSASERFGVPLSLLMALAFVESNFNPVAVSPAGAIGLTQIIIPTAKDIFSSWGIPFTKDFLFEPEINVKAGSYYLRKLKDDLGSWTLAIAGYNAGPNAVKRWIEKSGNIYCEKIEVFLENIPYRQTRFYTMRVLSYYLEYAKLFEEDIDLEEIFKCNTNKVVESSS